MATAWKRNAGRILCAGDSITVGYFGLTGGWRKKLFADLATANVNFTAVGPYTTNSPSMTATAHRGVSGDTASAAKTNFGSEVATYDPTVIIYGWGMNDMGNGRTSAQYLADMDTIIDAAQSNGFALHLVQTLILPTSAYAPYYANIAQYNSAAASLPTTVSNQGATLVNVGQPSLSDGVHPNDGSGGFDAMATAIYNAILNAIP